MSISYKTPSYFSSFSCLGGDCEDTCCRNWEVKLDRQHFDLLEKEMSKDNNEASMFEQYIHLNENSITSDHDYAFIRMGVNGYCAMLDEKGLCSIHAKYGVAVLGNVCTMFPRVISRCGDTIELSGALSCPEVVRNCIDDPTPLKLKRFKTSDLPRSKNYPILRELSHLDGDFYSENFDNVRDKLMQIVSNEEQELNTRLYVLANFANKISEFYHRDCTALEEGKLESNISLLLGDDIVTSLDRSIKEYDSESQLNMVVVHSILSIKLQQAGDENISNIYKNIIDKYTTANADVASTLAKKLNEIANNLSNENMECIDKSVTRYILNCLYREWFVSMPDPFTYVQMLLVRTSILQALIYLYIGDEELERHQLKQKIVYVMYNFARNIDQNLDFLKVVYNALSEQSMMNFDFSPAFIRIF
jgi:lysine-N-methylase